MHHVQLLGPVQRILILVLVFASCQSEGSTHEPDGLRTDPGIVDVESVGGLCLLRGDLRPLVGTVRVDLSDGELVWVEKHDGTRASVRWPSGFWLDRESPAVRDVVDALVAVDGTVVDLDTLDWQAEGTPDDPFVLVGDINGRCYG